MILHYEFSEAVLSEIWSHLRRPILPWLSMRAQEAIKACVRRGGREARQDLEAFAEEVCFHAAGGFAFTPQTRKSLLKAIARQSLSVCTEDSRPVPPLAAFCVQLETMGFDIDSEPLCAEAAWRRSAGPNITRAQIHPVPSWAAKRSREHVTMRGSHAGSHRVVRTLRTHRGYIIRARLGRDLEPLSIDVFGPKYPRVSDWIDRGAVWSLELRDAAGYDYRHESRECSFPLFERLA
jgi:hypothetical protein